MPYPCAVPGINLSDYGSRLPRAGWPGPCAGSYARVKINDAGAAVSVDVALAELVGLIMRANERDGYHYRPGDTGAYNCRKIGGTNSWSLHAYGLAIDENWQSNPYTSPLRTDKPAWLVQRWNRYGFAWGGHYSGKQDAMHFEFMGTPAQALQALALARAELGGAAPQPTPGVTWLPSPSVSPITGAREVPGFDCSYTKPGWVEMRSGGYKFMIGYVSPKSEKNLSAGNIADYRNAGMAVGLVWESAAGRALEGAAAGGADGAEADRQADALGYPTDAVLFFAVDVDTTSGNFGAIGAYAGAFNQATKRPVGIYGEFDVIEQFVTPGQQPVQYGWQTAAWSRDPNTAQPRLSGKANLYQRTGHPTWPVPGGVAANAFDENVALSPVPLFGWRGSDPKPAQDAGDEQADPQAREDQTNLNDTGFDCGTPDGFWGDKSTAACSAFQRAAGIAVDGVCGDQTRAMLRKVPSWHSAGPNVADDPGGYPASQWQQKLKDHGWRIAVDNEWREHSKSILSQYQADKGLVVDGLRGPSSWTSLYCTVN